MSKIKGRISKKFLDMVITGTSVDFLAGEKTVKEMNDIWFVYLQRISQRLKTCDAVFFDGQNIVEFTTEQANVEKIIDAVACPVYIGGLDPLPWKKLIREAIKHKWHREDWQHMFEEPELTSESDSEWKPHESDDDESDDDESDDDESDDDDESNDDEPPLKKLCRRPAKQTSHGSKSE